MQKTESLTRLVISSFVAMAVSTCVQAAPRVAKVALNGNNPATLSLKKGIKPRRPALGHNIPGIVTNISTPRRNAVYNAPLKSESSDWPAIYGNVIDSYQINDYGLYRLPCNPEDSFELLFTGIEGERGGAAKDGIYYITSYDYPDPEVTVTGIDLKTGETVYQADGTYGNVPIKLCYNPADSKLYGLFYKEDDSEGYAFGTIDYSTTTPVTTPIFDVPDGTYISICCNPQGDIFILRDVVDDYYTSIDTEMLKIDLANGSLTKIGNVGFASEYDTDACIDPVTGRMFYALCNYDTCSLIEVDLQTAAGTKLMDFPGQEEVIGMFCPMPEVSENAPAAVTDLTISFPDGCLTGNVVFRCPTTLANGETATGEATCHILVDNEETVTKTVTYGENVSEPIEFPASGQHSFTVYLSNDAGDGIKERQTAFIGTDTPALPSSLTASFADGMMTLDWEEVTTGVNGGYIDPSKVSYRLNQILPSEKLLCEATSSNQFSFQMEEPEAKTEYSFRLTVLYDNTVVGEIISDQFYLGNLMPPYILDFSSEDSMEDLTVIDVNDDRYVWSLFSNNVRIESNRNMASDDWLVLPGLKLTGGKCYKLSFRAWIQSSACPEKLEVKYGTEPTVASMTREIMGATVFNALEEEATTTSITLTPETTGVYYIGFHAISDADSWYLYLDDIAVTAQTTSGIPSAPSDLTATPDPLGNLSVDISLVAPSTTYDGQPLESLTNVTLYCNDTKIKQFDNPSPGAELSFTHIPEESGDYTYKAVAENEEGESEAATIVIYCGPDFPAAITGVTIAETENPGEIVLKWDPVTTDSYGNPINPQLVRYNIFSVINGVMTSCQSDFTATEFTHQAIDPSSQDFVKYAVYGVTDRGMGTGMESDLIPVGKAHDDFAESFADKTLSYLLGINSINQGNMELFDDEYFEDLASQDGDNGFMGIYGQYPGQGVEISTGKINLKSMVEPTFTLWVHSLAANDENLVEVEIREAGGVFSPILSMKVCEAGEPGWNRVALPLSDYAGKTIQLRLRGTIRNYGTLGLDNFSVASKSGLLDITGNKPAEIIRGGKGDITIEGMEEGRITVSTVDGRIVFSDENKISGNSSTTKYGALSIPVAPGIYIVKTNSTTAKVIVR